MTVYMVFRAAPGLRSGFLPLELDGHWSSVPIPADEQGRSIDMGEGVVARPTDRYERRDSDGAFAQIYEVAPENWDPVTVSKKRLTTLRNRSRWLRYLESAGVDNWPGIYYAHELRREDRLARRGEPQDEDDDDE